MTAYTTIDVAFALITYKSEQNQRTVVIHSAWTVFLAGPSFTIFAHSVRQRSTVSRNLIQEAQRQFVEQLQFLSLKLLFKPSKMELSLITALNLLTIVKSVETMIVKRHKWSVSTVIST